MEIRIVASQIFVTFSSFLISTHSENLIHLAVTVYKFKILEDSIEEDPQHGSPNFRRTLVLPDVFNRSKFEYCAFIGLKE